jgi:PEP-CTERM motif
MRSAAFNVCAGLAAGLLLVAARPAEAISVGFEGLPATVTAGQSFDVDVVVTGIVDEIISAWDIDVSFDPAALNALGVGFYGAEWGGDLNDAFYDSDVQNGLIDAWLVSLLSDNELRAAQCPGGACGPTLRLTTLSFTALADGAPVLSLVNWGPWNDIKCENNRQCFPVSTPEPGTLALLSLGLLGLGLGRRRTT